MHTACAARVRNISIAAEVSFLALSRLSINRQYHERPANINDRPQSLTAAECENAGLPQNRFDGYKPRYQAVEAKIGVPAP
jgi:hypothetical protein